LKCFDTTCTSESERRVSEPEIVYSKKAQYLTNYSA